jgi:uncharacterized HAD superfamily protein
LLVDLHFALIPMPRVFEWNLWHHSMMDTTCVDIDGVLCIDPTAAQNDDGTQYLQFLESALTKHIPSTRIAMLVTSRLEKYRPQTEAWLKNAGVKYDELVMLDLPDMETRRKLGIHGSFKAEVYQKATNCNLFIESDFNQAQTIAEITKKPVYCVETNEMYSGSEPITKRMRKKLGTQKNYFKSMLKKAIGR